MPSVVLTTKTASFGVLASLPTADVATTCVAINPTYYTAAISASAISPAVTLGQFIMIKVAVQNGVGATVRTLRLLKSSGALLLQFAAANQPALPTEDTVIYSARAIVTNAADWVNVTLQVSAGAAGDSVNIRANSLVFAFAQFCNIIDTRFVKYNLANLSFITMQAAQEAALGKLGTAADIAFTTVAVNGLVSGIQWSTNSGNTLWDWSGSSITISS